MSTDDNKRVVSEFVRRCQDQFIDIFRVADGMLIEHWTSMDLGALRSQLQAK